MNTSNQSSNYTIFIMMLIASAISMYITMYFNTYQWDHVYFSWTRMYMTLMGVFAMANIGEAHIHIDYSSPSVRSRTIWGGWVAYDQVWVMGALKSFFLGRGNLINRQP